MQLISKKYLIELAATMARPIMCEVALQRFLRRVNLEAKDEHDVQRIFLEYRKPGKAKKLLKVITQQGDKNG